MTQPPVGTVAFLFTDIEGSTRLWESGPDAMRAALADRDEITRASIEANGGHVFKTIGDAFCAAFHTAPEAVAAALDIQLSLQAEQWAGLDSPLLTRVAVHAGAVQQRGGDYFGPPLNRIARLLFAGHGGQILVSAAAQELSRDSLPAECDLLDLGDAALKDLARPERVYQLRHPDLPASFPALRSLRGAGMPNNLPQQPTSFIGREHELAEIKKLLLDNRLLTLVGPGGAGKTRLALQAAADLLGGEGGEGGGDGVWLIELAALTDPELVASAAAQALGVKERRGVSVQQTLTDALRSKTLLIVLDNCEHVLDACASLADALLRHCPGARVLATSREALGVAGEQIYRVPSLSAPAISATSAGSKAVTAEALSTFDSVRLLIDRAKAVQPAFTVTDANAPAVAQLCANLDGIPLAIELAAARLRSLTPEEVNARLTQRFRLLTGGSRAALPRQQTLKALIDWSYDLLSTREQALLVQLSVFAGGWTLAAAESVCAAEIEIEDWEMLDHLTSLADKSLVSQGDPEPEPVDGALDSAGAGAGVSRYRMLESVRQYGQDRLAEEGQGASQAARRRHADWCASLAAEAERHLSGAEQAYWLDALETEHDNLRAALAWREQDESDEGSGIGIGIGMLSLAAALQKFWDVRGHYFEGRAWLERALGRAGPLFEGNPALPPLRAKVLGGLGTLAFSQGDYAQAREFYQQSLDLSRACGDEAAEANTRMNLGGVERSAGDFAAARALLEESLLISRRTGEEQLVAYALINLGNVAYSQGDLTAARSHYQESAEISRRLGNLRSAANAIGNLGFIAFELDDPGTGVALMQEKLDIHRRLGDQKGTASALLNLSIAARLQGNLGAAGERLRESLEIARRIGDQETLVQALEESAQACSLADPERAACLWAATAVLRERIGLTVSPGEQQSVAEELTKLRQALGDSAYKAAWARGRTMSMEQAIEAALSNATPPCVSPSREN